MKKTKALKLDREVIRKLTTSEAREVVGGYSKPAICYQTTGGSCDCTQIC